MTLSNDETESTNPNQTDKVHSLTKSWVLFHDPLGRSYATIQVGSHRETWPVKSDQVRNHLLLAAKHNLSRFPSNNVTDAVANALDAEARLSRPEEPVFLRVAGDEHVLYLDLCDPLWRVVRVDADGWKIDPNPPVKFIRKAGMLALPEPMPGGSIDELRPLVNGRDETTWRLMVAWLLSTFQPHGPYPCMFVYGGEGTLKTSTSTLLRNLVDPNHVPLRPLPASERDLAIAGGNSRILAFDNVSALSPSMSDAFCRVATGGGLATRKLYTDDSETLINVERPLLANGIERFVTRPDLVDRGVFLELPVVPGNDRRPREDVLDQFAKVHPRILGAILDTISAILRELPQVTLMRHPRMADFVRWVTAAESDLGWAAGSFQELYERHQSDGRTDALDADLVFPVIESLLAHASEWTGTMTELLAAVQKYWSERQPTPRDLPASIQQLNGRLRRISRALASAGIEEQRHRSGEARTLTFRRQDPADALDEQSAAIDVAA